MAKIPTLSAADSKPWLVVGRISTIFGIAASIGAFIAYAMTNTFSVPAVILAVYICVLVSVLFALLLSQERRYLREARYAHAMLPLWKAFSEVTGASWQLLNGKATQNEFRVLLRESLRRFADVFTLVTGTPCRACIKLIQVPDDPLSPNSDVVSTLCRSNEGAEPPRHVPDLIRDNTDFKQIFTGNKAAFFSNDLVALLKQGYKNSHWQEEDILDGKFDYVATIVWPIERGNIWPLETPSKREIVGFLCVDALQKEAFIKSYDEALGASFARALYVAVHRFREIARSASPVGNN